MRAGRGAAVAFFLMAAACVGVLWAAGEETPPPSKAPIRDSIEPAVERFVRERLSCRPGVPCFPVTVEVKGRVYSVRETLDQLEPTPGPVPGSLPTHAEMIQHGANPHPASGSVGFDPKALACKTRQLLKKVQGRSATYYLYRVWDETGERAILRDTPLDPEVHGRSPHFRYVSLGEFGDECEAIKAYRASTHDVRRRREIAEDEAAAGTDPGIPSPEPPE